MPNTAPKPIYKNLGLYTLKEAMKQYRNDNEIIDDFWMNILYKDGTILTYPDDIEQIKLINIKNIHWQSGDGSGDFYHDDIATQEEIDFKNWLKQECPDRTFAPIENQLIIEDSDDYYNNYFDR